jgi:hypothetical protein
MLQQSDLLSPPSADMLAALDTLATAASFAGQHGTPALQAVLAQLAQQAPQQQQGEGEGVEGGAGAAGQLLSKLQLSQLQVALRCLKGRGRVPAKPSGRCSGIIIIGLPLAHFTSNSARAPAAGFD